MNLRKITNKTQKTLHNYWKYWTILAIFGIIIYLGFVFYQCLYKPIYSAKEVNPQKLEIKENVYKKIMDLYTQKEQNINEVFNKNYIDIFK